jgi:hypothetical protein
MNGEQSADPQLSTMMRSEFQHLEILDWFDRRTFGPSNPGPFKPGPGLLAEVKRELGLRVSVCPPALSEKRPLVTSARATARPFPAPSSSSFQARTALLPFAAIGR